MLSLLREKRQQDFVEFVLRFQMGNMPDVGQFHQPCPWNQRGGLAAQLFHNQRPTASIKRTSEYVAAPIPGSRAWYR